MQFISKTLVLSLFVSLLVGCSTISYRAPTTSTPPQVEERSVISTPRTTTDNSTSIVDNKTTTPPPSSTVTSSPAVIALLGNAEQQQQIGDYPSAINTLQRAQRIAPQDPTVYYQLAQTHRALETYTLAEQVALKGVSVAAGQTTILKKLWQLIADIRMQSGDSAGANKAKAQAAKY